MAEAALPALEASTVFVEKKIDGVLIPKVIGNELYFNEQKQSFTEFDETTL